MNVELECVKDLTGSQNSFLDNIIESMKHHFKSVIAQEIKKKYMFNCVFSKEPANAF